MHNITLTVFTPTYNRKEKLTQLYDSLKKQTDKDFLWLIVDDGSTDDTKTLVDSFLAESVLNIRYVYQQNGGKYKAHNHGVRLCETELFVCVDSDDTLLPKAIERTKELWSIIRDDKSLCGIVSPRKLFGEKKFVNPPEKGTLMNLYNKGHFSGDTMLVFRTDILKQYLFPEIDGENFMHECVIYNQIDQKYVLYYHNEFLSVGEYLEDGLTRNMSSVAFKNPIATMLVYKNAAAFQTKFIKASREYAMYLAWKKIHGLTDTFCEYKVRFWVRVAGFLLKGHYSKLFRKQILL